MLNLHVKTPVLLIMIDFYHTNIDLTLAVLIGQMMYLFFYKKLKIKFHSKQNISDAVTVKELCNMRNSADFNLLSSSEITKLIDDICIN